MIAHDYFSPLRRAGRSAAQSSRMVPEYRGRTSKPHLRALQDAIVRKAAERSQNARWLFDNARLIRTAIREVRDAQRSFRHPPGAIDESGTQAPRVHTVARQYLSETGNVFS